MRPRTYIPMYVEDFMSSGWVKNRAPRDYGNAESSRPRTRARGITTLREETCICGFHCLECAKTARWRGYFARMMHIIKPVLFIILVTVKCSDFIIYVVE